MRSVALVLVITFALTLFSCNHASDTPGFESGEDETAPTEKQVYLLYTTLDYLENYKYTYYYDANGNLIERHEFSQNGETVFTYQYDGQNRLVSKSCGGQIIETYSYESDGSYRAQTVDSENEYRLYNRDGKITERHFGTASKWVYSYNADGVLVEFTSYSGNDIKEKQIRQLDEHGNVIKIIKQSSSGTETVLGENEYKLYTVKVR